MYAVTSRAVWGLQLLSKKMEFSGGPAHSSTMISARHFVAFDVPQSRFRHKQDSVGTRGLYWHNKTSLLAWNAKMTPTKNVPGTKQPQKDIFHVKSK